MQAELQDGIGDESDAVTDVTDVVATDPVSDAGPDAELLRRIGLAARFRADYMVASDTRKSLLDALRDHPEYRALKPDSPAARRKYRELARSTGYEAADLHCRKLFSRYDKAVRAVMPFRARTVAGVRAKLRLGRHAARRGEGRIYAYGDYEWLKFALADLYGW